MRPWGRVQLVLLLLVTGTARAQDGAPTPPATDGYIANLDTLLSLRINANDHIESFALPINGQEARIAQNTVLKSTLTVNYRILAFSVSYAPGFIEGNRDAVVDAGCQTKPVTAPAPVSGALR